MQKNCIECMHFGIVNVICFNICFPYNEHIIQLDVSLYNVLIIVFVLAVWQNVNLYKEWTKLIG